MKKIISSSRKTFYLNSGVTMIFVILFVILVTIIIGLQKNNNSVDDSRIDFFVTANNEEQFEDGSKQHPFHRVEDVVEQIKQIEKDGSQATKKDYVVALRAGKYSKTIIKDYNLDNKISFINYNQEQVEFSQMQGLDNNKFTSLSTAEQARLSLTAQNKVYKIDLSGYNFTDKQLGKIYTKGQYLNDKNDPLYNASRIQQSNLYVNDTLQNLARYPNEGPTLRLGEVRKNSTITKKGNGATFVIDETSAARVASWQSTNDAWIYGYFAHDWADSSTSIDSFNKSTNEITTTYGHNYGYVKDGNFLFENIFEELDDDNEWYLDHTNKTLYLYSESGIAGKKIELITGNEVILTVDNCKNISFNGFNFSGSRKYGIEISNSSDIVVTNCQIKCFSQDAVYITASKNIIVDNNELFSLGEQAIVLAGKTDVFEFQNIEISNNDIHDFGQIKRTYSAAISIAGIGNIIKNNKIYNAPHLAMLINGNCNLIQNNEIFNVCTDSGDCGAIYLGRSFSNYGNIIKSNYIHDIQYRFFNATTTRGYKPNAIYLDDFISGQAIINNIIANVGGQYKKPDGSNVESGFGIFVNGGRDITIEGNVLLGARIEYRATARSGYNSGNQYYTDPSGTFFTIVNAGKVLNTKWGNVFARVNNLSVDKAEEASSNFAVNPVGKVKNNVVIYNYISESRRPLIITSFLQQYGGINEGNFEVKLQNTASEYGKTLMIEKAKDIDYVRQYLLLMTNKHYFLGNTRVLDATLNLNDRKIELEY